jgi:hypothetical protein
MKFPVTRESLQAFDSARDGQEEQEEQNQKRLMEAFERLCKDFKQRMRENSKEKKFVWKQLNSVGYLMSTRKAEYLPQFIEKLKEVFIGCDIIIDPLETYLIIDWS